MGTLAGNAVTLTVASKLLQVGFYLAVGFFVLRWGVISRAAVPELSSLVFKLMFPAVIFASLVTSAHTLTLTRLLTPAVAFGYGTVVFLSALYLPRLGRGRSDPSFASVCTHGNTAFLGIPLCAALFGPAGGALAALYDFGLTVVMWTVSAYFLVRFRPAAPGLAGASPATGTGSAETAATGRPRSLARDLVNPNTVALVLGLLIGKSPLTVPGPLLGAIQGIAATALPLAMLVVGAMIASANPFTAGDRSLPRRLALGALTKLALGPALAFALTTLLGLPPFMRSVIVLQSAMPTMASTPVFLRHFGGDEQLAASAVLVTTILCFATIPLILQLMG